ncbi:S8 family serine peptidase, partial [Xenorhabdus sp. XENO-1]|uniref:S8 family serine peptidase n=1 Tax=Xenorhabdus bovienii TaxID=40576 RepID=UPI0020CA77FE
IRIADIEWGFNFNHINLKRDTFVELIPLSKHDYDYHGTAVAGVLYAKDNSFGITGMVHDADILYGVSEYLDGNYNRVNGITKGLEQLRAGDVFLFEMQEYFGEPADYNRAVWELTKAATDAGIIIVATAGNGKWNLDSDKFAEYRSWGDNGAIMVGAGTKIGRNRCDFSTYGSKVHVQGWGDWTVATTGVGDLYNGEPLGDHDYTNSFSGTSSAGPIVASAVVAIQSWYKRETNRVLTPHEMRELLIETGIPQGTDVNGHIGPLPNIQKAIKKLQAKMLAHLVNKYPDNFIKSALFIPLEFNKNEDSKIEYQFNYDNSQINSVGFVCAYPEQGPSDLLWHEDDYSLVKVPVVNEFNEIDIIYLRVTQNNECGSQVMNASALLDSSNPNKLKLECEYFKEDNAYIKNGEYKGTLPLYAKSWSNHDYSLNIMINVIIK